MKLQEHPMKRCLEHTTAAGGEIPLTITSKKKLVLKNLHPGRSFKRFCYNDLILRLDELPNHCSFKNTCVCVEVSSESEDLN